jgi:predicted PurR-regulated permease PerM
MTYTPPVTSPIPPGDPPATPERLRTPEERQLVTMLRWLLYAVFIVVAWNITTTLASVLAPILAAVAIAYLLDPVLERMVARGVSRAVAATILLALFLGVMIALGVVLIPLAIQQVREFIDDLPAMLDNATAWLADRGVEVPRPEGAEPGAPITWEQYVESPEFQAVVEKLMGPAEDLAAEAVGGVLTLLTYLAEALLIPVFAYYFLLDWPNITARVKKMIPPRRRGKVLEILGDIDGVVSGWVRGQAIVTGLLAVLYALCFWGIGIHLAIPIGLLVGALTIIPFVGTFVGAAITFTVILLDWQGFDTLVYVAIVFVGLHLLEAAVLTPKIVGHKVGLSESAALFAVVAGGKLLGFVGILLAVPLAATVAVLIRHAYRRYEKSSFFGHEDDAIVPVTDAMAMVMPKDDLPGTRRSAESPDEDP